MFHRSLKAVVVKGEVERQMALVEDFLRTSLHIACVGKIWATKLLEEIALFSVVLHGIMCLHDVVLKMYSGRLILCYN